MMAQENQNLKLDDAKTIMNDLHMLNSGDIKANVGDDPKLDAQAEQLANTLVDFDTKDQARVSDIRSAVENMGYQVQTQAAKQSEMLKKPVKDMMARSEEGQSVGKALIDLKMTVEDLDPASIDLSAGWVSRTMGYLPFVGSPIKRYFSKFESSQTVINSIIGSLEKGRDQLNRDNITLTEDQKRMRQMTLKLEQSVRLGQLLDQKISYKLERDIPQDDPRHKFIQEEILFALRQRIMDLQQQLAVNQQGVLATEIVIRNNKELIRGVNRALNVTVNALQVAVTVALALENQKIVLDKVNALSKTTDTLIANTAARLRTQGAEIHKQASSSSLSIESLKQAFVDINAAMDDIATYRTNALPQMAKSILEMDGLAAKAEESILKMEKAKLAAPSIQIEVL
jgi:uncharacterized protein YaaN involved in tellurite resistance